MATSRANTMFLRFKGMAFFIAGLVLLFIGVVAFLLTPWDVSLSRISFVVLMLTVTLSFLFGANFLVVGFFRMLVHLYARVSQMDPRTDRRMRGQSTFLAGQLGATTFGVLGAIFAFGRDAHTLREFFLVMLFLLFGVGFVVCFMVLLCGFAWMLFDFFLRVQELRQNPRFDPRRKFAEVSAEGEEVVPTANLVQLSEAAAIRTSSPSDAPNGTH